MADLIEDIVDLLSGITKLFKYKTFWFILCLVVGALIFFR